MKGKIYKQKGKNNEIILPVTVSDAVQMPDGSTLTNTINNINNNNYEKSLYLGLLIQGKPTKINNTYDGISTTGIDATNNVVMNDCIAVPYRKCSLNILIPEGIAMKIVLNYNPSSNGIESQPLIGKINYTIEDNIIYYRCYFYRLNGEPLDVETINTYINSKKLKITYFDLNTNNIAERNDEACCDVITATLKEYSSTNKRVEDYQYMMLCHTSDIHGDAYRIKNFYDWCKYIRCDYAIFTGDAVAETTYNGQKFLSNICNVKTLVCTGNHDCNFSNTDLDVYNNVIKPFSDRYEYVHPSNNTTYYYVDDVKWKVRFISLDIYGSISSYDKYNVRISQEQINWFVSTLATTPENYGVIVIMHTPEKELQTNNLGFLQSEIPGLEYHTNKSGNVISIIIDAFIGKTTFNTSYTQRQKNSNSNETISVSGDFTNVASNEFICYITGHEHADMVGYYNNTTHRQLMLSVCSGMGVYGKLFGSTYRATINCSDIPRGFGKIEDSFNTYIINRDNKNVIVVRVGSNINRFRQDRKYATIKYVDD